MNPLDLLILSLATWRSAYFIVKDNGPFNFMGRIRARWTDGEYPGSFGELLTCIYCASVWCGLVMWAIYQTPAYPVVQIVAISGGALMLHRYTGGMHT